MITEKIVSMTSKMSDGFNSEPYQDIVTESGKNLHLWYGPNAIENGDTILLPHNCKIHQHITCEPDLPGGKLLVKDKGQAIFVWLNAPESNATELLTRCDSCGTHLIHGWPVNVITGPCVGLSEYDMLLPAVF